MTQDMTKPKMPSGWLAPLLGMLLSIMVAFSMLYAYNAQRIQADDFALGKQNTSRAEVWEGLSLTAHNIEDVAVLVREQAQWHAQAPVRRRLVAWFGNSQLHTLNQFKPGQHLAPYWLKQWAGCGDCIQPLGLSLSNANPQETLVLSRYVASKLPLSMVMLEVEFMGFREDAVRGDFARIVTDELQADLSAYPVAKELTALRQAKAKDAKAASDKKTADGGLDGNFQKHVESVLSDRLADIWPLWHDRAYLRSNLLGDLFTLRNRIFNISSQSQRKIIRPRYVRNMTALRNMLESFRRDGVSVVLYLAPIRGDKPLPYDKAEYGQWKQDVADLAKAYSAQCLNLESLVPAGDWGSNFGEDIDFMHFQESGHKRLAQALLPLVRKEKEAASCSSTL